MAKNPSYNFWQFLADFSKSKKFLLTVGILLGIVAILLATGYLSYKNGRLTIGPQDSKIDTTQKTPDISQSSTGNQSPNIQSGGDVNVSYGDSKTSDTARKKKDSLIHR